MTEETVTKRLSIHGRVQGVYFRGSMQQPARQLSVNGWVCNRINGTVEAIVHGKPAAVMKIIEWVRQSTAAAKVTDVQVEEAHGQFDSFDLLPTS